MTEAALPRGRGPVKPTHGSAPKKVKLFGIKSKAQKPPKQKKSTPKIKSRISAKDYAQGCIVLGSVRSVEDDAVYFDLPGSVRGVLLLTEINDHFLERLRLAVEQQSASLPALDDFFSFGDFVTAVVLSNETQPVELSIRPQLLNVGLKLTVGQVLPGAVKSKVDHGFLVDLGNDSIEGFLPNPSDVSIGQPLCVCITAVSSPTLVRVELFGAGTFYPTIRIDTIHIDEIRPYTVMKSSVKDSLNSGTCGRHLWLPGAESFDEVIGGLILIDPAQKILCMTTIVSIVDSWKRDNSAGAAG
jgi:hypothetical protein